MRFYSWLDRLFPNSYLTKLVCIAWIGILAPVLAVFIAAGTLSSANQSVALVLGVTVLALVAVALALRQVLAPLSLLSTIVSQVEAGQPVRALPEGYRDQMGQLMERTNHLVAQTETRIGAATRRSERDPLTGLLNRRGLERRLPGALSGSVLLLDLDHFKSINDSFGHDAGDRILRALGGLLTDVLRKRDLAARLGGEEFVVYLPGLHRDAAWQVGERLRIAAEDRLSTADRTVTLSVGVAPRLPGASFSALLKAADRAVYRAKESGRNRVEIAAMAEIEGYDHPERTAASSITALSRTPS